MTEIVRAKRTVFDILYDYKSICKLGLKVKNENIISYEFETLILFKQKNWLPK